MIEIIVLTPATICFCRVQWFHSCSNFPEIVEIKTTKFEWEFEWSFNLVKLTKLVSNYLKLEQLLWGAPFCYKSTNLLQNFVLKITLFKHFKSKFCRNCSTIFCSIVSCLRIFSFIVIKCRDNLTKIKHLHKICNKIHIGNSSNFYGPSSLANIWLSRNY